MFANVQFIGLSLSDPDSKLLAASVTRIWQSGITRREGAPEMDTTHNPPSARVTLQ
jgi:hypothetical protein